MEEHNSNEPQIPDYQCRTLIIGGCRSGRTNSYNLMNHQPDIDKIHL